MQPNRISDATMEGMNPSSKKWEAQLQPNHNPCKWKTLYLLEMKRSKSEKCCSTFQADLRRSGCELQCRETLPLKVGFLMWNKVPPASQNSSATSRVSSNKQALPWRAWPPQLFHQSLNVFPSQKRKKLAALTVELPLGPVASCLHSSRYDWERSDNHLHAAFDWAYCKQSLRRLEPVRCQQLAHLPPVPTKSPPTLHTRTPGRSSDLRNCWDCCGGGPEGSGGLRDGCEGLTGSGGRASDNDVARTETDSSTEITLEDDRDPDATPLRSKTGAGPSALGTRGLGPSQTSHACRASCTGFRRCPGS